MAFSPFCCCCCSLSNSQGLGWYGTMTGCGSNSYTVSPHLNGPVTDTAPLLFTCSNLDMSNHHSLYVTPQNWEHYRDVRSIRETTLGLLWDTLATASWASLHESPPTKLCPNSRPAETVQDNICVCLKPRSLGANYSMQQFITNTGSEEDKITFREQSEKNSFRQ